MRETLDWLRQPVKDGECKHEFVYNEQSGESVCVKCGHALTKEEKRYALAYAMDLMQEDDDCEE